MFLSNLHSNGSEDEFLLRNWVSFGCDGASNMLGRHADVMTESIFLNIITNVLYTFEHYIVVAADSGGTVKSTYKQNICYT
jgi:hypothetical protein